MSDLKISIYGRNDNNNITEKEYPKAAADSIRIAAMGGVNASKNVRILFEPFAVEKLFETIGWGSKYKSTDVEQAGALYGNYHRDLSGNEEIIWADVVAIIPADPTLVNATFSEIDINTLAWKRMYEDADKYRNEKLQIVGWYHTHLDHIKTRFSSVDIRTQRKAFTYEYSFGVVFNPNQKKWSAFYGPDSRECIGELIYNKELETKHAKESITIKQVNGDSESQQDEMVVHQSDEDRSIVYKPNELKGTPETLSLGQLVGQFLVDIGQLMIKTNTNNENGYSKKSIDQPSKEPKIKIKNFNQNKPNINCRYFTMCLDGTFLEYPNFGCSIRNSDIYNVIQRRRKTDISNKVLWGDISVSDTTMKLILVQQEKANTKIVFTHNKDNNVNQLVAIGIQLTSKLDTKFTVLINDVDPQKIEVLVIHFSRGNLI